MIESWFVPLWDSVPPIVLAGLLGAVSAVLAFFLTDRSLNVCEAPSKPLAVKWSVACGLCVAAFVYFNTTIDVLSTPEVQPTATWLRLRIVSLSGLIVLLTAITATDWRTCYIPMLVPYIGLVVGPLVALISGDLQISHVWVDWRAEVPQLSGPYLPAWLGEHPHLHGLAWSLAGIFVGTVMTWVVRRVSGWALGRPALGDGDVWLMAMIGAFLGWQPTVFAFAIAPLAAIVIGLPAKYVTGRPYMPYGPFLAFGAMCVLFAWRAMWMLEVNLGTAVNARDRRATFRIRDVFGDVWLMAGVAGVVVVALAVMLGWRRVTSRSDRSL